MCNIKFDYDIIFAFNAGTIKIFGQQNKKF